MKKIRTMMITLTACLALAATAYAGNMRGMGNDDQTPWGRDNRPGFYGCGMMGGPCGISIKQLLRLDLTDAQRAEVTAVIEKHREARQSLMNQLMDAREACAQNQQPDVVFDETAIRQTHQQVSAVKEEMAVLRGKIMAELKPILTEAQLEALSRGPSGPGGKGKTKPYKGRMRMDRPMPDCPMMN